MRTPVLATVTAAVLASACATGAGSAGDSAGGPETCLEGLLSAWSTEMEQHLDLALDDGAAVALRDDRVSDLPFLNGARVQVCGHVQEDGSMEVTEYDIRAVDGAPAHMGILHEDSRGLVLQAAEGERYRLTGAPPGLAARVGARVWVSVRDSADGLRVVAWGAFPTDPSPPSS